MDRKSKKYAALSIIAILFILIASSAVFFTGCAEKLSGTLNENMAPIVEFVNIPPGPVTIYDSTYALNPAGTDSTLIVDTIVQYARFSRNPFIYWYGTDPDGQVDYYFYAVATEIDVGASTPEQYLIDVLDAQRVAEYDTTYEARYDVDSGFTVIDTIVDVSYGPWVKLDVIPSESNPRTTEIVKMRALSEDPVNRYLVQYVYLFAVDDEGKHSETIYRAFSRNDSPPETTIGYLAPGVPFIDTDGSGALSGVMLTWGANDPDYPAGDNAPPFDYQWRLYGPYEDFNNDDSVFNRLREDFVENVYVTQDAKVYHVGDTIKCEEDDGDDCVDLIINAGHIGQTDLGITRGRWRLRLDIEAIDADSVEGGMYRPVTGSGGWPVETDSTEWWTNDSNIIVNNIYRNYIPPEGGDTTVQMNFMLWVTSRDDASVTNAIPAYTLNGFEVIKPKFERPFLVIDFSPVVSPLISPVIVPDSGSLYTARNFWKNLIDSWGEQYYDKWGTWSDTTFNVTLGPSNHAPDYLRAASLSPNLPISTLLKHKVLILYNDDIFAPTEGQYEYVAAAVEAGANVWMTARAPIIGGMGTPPIFDVPIGGGFARYVAVRTVNWGGWFYLLFNHGVRQEDFIAASSGPDLGNWPNLPIDTARLHSMYTWTSEVFDGITWRPDLAALPEVNWMSFRDKQTFSDVVVIAEPMYLYVSRYGQGGHFLGGPRAQYHGAPVGHWVRGDYISDEEGEEAGNFKSVCLSFTPLAIQQDSLRIASDQILNYLIDPDRMEP